jgi:anti-sigma B factor antagonist
MAVQHPNPGAGVIDIAGEVTAAAEDALMDAFTRASEGDARTIVLDFHDLTYMNSSGIGLLVTLLVRINRAKQRLLTYGLSDHYKHIFELTRLNDAIGIFDTEDQALKAAQS